jgi:hypothetical protein
MSQPGDEVVLHARGVVYYSANDEAAFFGWLDKLSCVTSYVGRGDTLYITVKRAAVDVEAFSELNALHLRYGVDREQLKALDTGRFAAWFTD